MHKATAMLLGTGLGLAVWNALFWFAFLIAEKRGKDFSPTVLPLIGPLACLAALLLGHRPAWQPLLFAACDVGNVVLVRFTIDEWKTSRWTRIAAFEGRVGNREIRLSLHRRGHFFLNSKWNRPQGEMGIVGSGETGTYESRENGYVLTLIPSRILEMVREEGGYRVVDPIGDLDGWRLSGIEK